jgi:hypothetical protein
VVDRLAVEQKSLIVVDDNLVAEEESPVAAEIMEL